MRGFTVQHEEVSSLTSQLLVAFRMLCGFHQHVTDGSELPAPVS